MMTHSTNEQPAKCLAIVLVCRKLMPKERQMSTQEETIEMAATLTLADRLAFLKLPIEERRRILAQQAEALAAEYDLESNRAERELWQGGDIVEY